MHTRAIAILELNKIQSVRGREEEIRSRIRILPPMQKRIGSEGIAKRLKVSVRFVADLFAGNTLIGDKTYEELLKLSEELQELEEQERDRKRKENILPIEDAIEEVGRKIMELEQAKEL